jgi:hypothetical protein
MSEPLDELYFVWLYRQVGDPDIKSPTRTYWRMFRKLFTKEFVWVIPNDDNRIEDGKDLRYEFVDQTNLNDIDPGWIHLGCSMFELLVGLSRRLSFYTEGDPKGWFWHLIENVHLEVFTDAHMKRGHTHSEGNIDDILDRIIWRTYDYNGRGGLFPLEFPKDDQRTVELWYQLNAYLLEKTNIAA